MPNYLLTQAIDRWQDLNADKVAIKFQDKRISYRELSLASNKLARCLKSIGVERHDRIALCLKRSINSIVSILGILKADAIYVPVDPKTPIDRFSLILQDCQPKVLICTAETADLVSEASADLRYKPQLLLLVDRKNVKGSSENNYFFQEEIDKQNSEPFEGNNIDVDPAYILYTSGSTGKPKGVVISHLNILNYINWAIEYLNITSVDNILSTAPFHFDMSTFDIYCPLSAGATLVIAPEKYLLFPAQLLTLIEENQITIWKAISSLLVYLAKTGSMKPDRISTLQKILFAGEVLPTKHLIHWMDIYPDKQYYNAYGPTEATGISTCYHIKKKPANPDQSIPIGGACANTEVFLLKDDDSLVKTAEAGEICIRGSGISGGYWNDKAKTERVFTINPLTNIPGDRIYRTGDLGKLRDDGNIEFIGRRDFQIKYMGYRIELSEIENAMLILEEIDEVAVILTNSNSVDIPEMVAFFTARRKVDLDHVYSVLKNRLPPHMLPQHIIPLTTMPRTDRGKIDRESLDQFYRTWQSENQKES